MIRFSFVAALLLLSPVSLVSQMAGTPPQTAAAQPPAKREAPKPAATAAPGGGDDKVWVNLNSATYHCPGARFYGRTANGRYMTEPAAKAAGAHSARGKACFSGK